MKIIERIYDATTGETTDVERTLTAAEVKEMEAIRMEAAKRQAAIEQEAAAKEAAQAKLAALGLTTDDLKALGL
jgi:hypothetical protein